MADDEITPELLVRLARYDTPTICNALEVVAPERRAIGFTTRPLLCLYPGLKPIVGFARTATFRATQSPTRAPAELRARTLAYYEYVATGGPVPSICLIEDLDGARAGFGALWGEVNTHIHKGLGCLGVVTNGSVRDVDANAREFQMLCGMVAPSHAHFQIVDFGIHVNVAGVDADSGDLVHADRHGAVIIPKAAAARLPAAAEQLAKREAIIIAAAKEPGFNIDRLKAAIASASEIH